MRYSILTIAFLATPLAGASVHAFPSQEVPIVASAMLTPDAASPSIYMDREGDVHTAMGRTWKAQFDANGAAFIPFLGSTASRNYPVTFRVTRVQQGTEAAALAAPLIETDCDRVSLDRGAIRSEYVLGQSGVEQLFVLPKPVGIGAITVSVEVETDLKASPDGAGWRFEGPEGGMRYGAAFAVDAKGQRLDLETAFDGDALQFVLPESFVRSAAWPIAIDPFLTSTNVDLDGKDQLEVDVAFDPVTERYLVVFEEAFSATDADVKSQLVDLNGTVVLGSDEYMSLGTRDTRRPRVACTPAQRSFLTVYTLFSPAGDPAVIRARSRNADTDLLGTTFVVDQQTALRRDHADVCGDSFSDPNSAFFTVVWEREWSPTDSDIVMRVCSPSGTVSPNEVLLSSIAGVRDEQPSLCNSITPSTSESQLVFRRHDPMSGTSRIFGATIRFDGGLFIGPYLLSGGAPGAYSNPAVAGGGRDPLGSWDGTIAVWEETVAPGNRDIVALAYSPVIATGVLQSSRQFNLSLMEQVDASLDQHSPAIAVTGDRFVISYASQFPGRTDNVIRATSANIVDGDIGLTESHLGLETSTDESRSPKIASPWEHGSALMGMSAPCLTSFVRSQTTTSQGDIGAALHTVHPFPAAGVQNEFCLGQPNSSLVGSYLSAEYFSQGLREVRLNAARLPTSVAGYFLASLVPGSGITPPNSSGTLCLGGSIGRYALSVLNSGTTGTFEFVVDLDAIRQPNGPVVGMMGETWYFQGWHRDSGSGPATSNFTNAVGVPIQ